MTGEWRGINTLGEIRDYLEFTKTRLRELENTIPANDHEAQFKLDSIPALKNMIVQAGIRLCLASGCYYEDWEEQEYHRCGEK